VPIGRATTPGNSVSYRKHGRGEDDAWRVVVARCRLVDEETYQSNEGIIVYEVSYASHL
jgi:hypothetical protein